MSAIGEVQCRLQNKELLPYFKKMDSLVDGACSYAAYRKNETASKIFDHLYIASIEEATDVDLIRELGVTHVINCCAGDQSTTMDFYTGTKVRRLVHFSAEDACDYDILQHFEEAFEAIEDARTTNGVALIHCLAGVNRSGALAVAYVSAHRKCGPISALRCVLEVRRVLSNRDFSDQLIMFAKNRDLLYLDSKEL